MPLPHAVACSGCATPAIPFAIGPGLSLCPTCLGAYVSSPEGSEAHRLFVAGARAWVARQAPTGPQLVKGGA